MNPSTPLTRCNTCQTVFEVPQSILDSSDSRVRCGECLQVFDASKNLHLVEKQDLSVLAVEYVGPTDDEEPRQVVDTDASDAGISLTPAKIDSTSAQAGSSGSKQTGNKHLSARQQRKVDAADKASQVGDQEEDNAAAVNADTSSGQEQQPDAQLENTHTDFDLFGRETELPEVSFEDSTMDAIRLDFDLVEDIDDQTLSDTMFANDVTIDAASHTAVTTTSVNAEDSTADADSGSERTSSKQAAADYKGEGVTKGKSGAVSRAEKTLAAIARSANTDFQLDDGAAPAPLEFDYRTADTTQPQSQVVRPETSVPATLEADALEQSSVSSPVAAKAVADHDHTAQQVPLSPRRGIGLWRWISRAFMVVLVLAIVAALYTWRHRGQLADNAITRPGYQLWCLFSDCEVPARLDTSKLAVLSKKIFSHPNLDDALVITIVIKNNATFEQRYPNLFLWLSDRMRRTVASSEFAPEVYLQENDLAADSVLAPGQQQRISIDVLDPGDEAVSLELDFR